MAREAGTGGGGRERETRSASRSSEAPTSRWIVAIWLPGLSQTWRGVSETPGEAPGGPEEEEGEQGCQQGEEEDFRRSGRIRVKTDKADEEEQTLFGWNVRRSKQ